MNKTTLACFSVLLTLTMFFTACSKDQPTQQSTTTETAKTQAPVTLKLQIGAAYNQVFQTYVEPALKKVHPNITLQYIDPSQKIEDEVAAGDIPDIYGPNGNLTPYLNLNLQYDMRDLIKKYNFDINQIEPSLIKSVLAYSQKGEIYALPSDRNVHDLLYNKDIFDKFGVEYPKDGMTWDQVIALGKKVTRVDGSTPYYGLNFNYQEMPTELELHHFGPDGKAQVTTTDWQKVAAAYLSAFPLRNPKGGNMRDQFTKDQNTAMIITNSSFLLRNPVQGLNWDYVVEPTFDNHLIAPTLGQMLSVTNASKNKDAAFQVLQVYYSTEVQADISHTGSLVPVGNDAQILKAYGTNLADNSKKNLMADFNGKAAVKVVEENDDVANPVVNAAFNDIANGKVDINTALRTAQEQVDLAVKEKTH